MQKNLFIISCLLAFAFSGCNHSPATDGKTALKDSLHASADSCASPISTADSLKFVSRQVEVKGDVEFPLVLTVDSLKKMNVALIDTFNVVCQSGVMKEKKMCKGVLLKDILDKAKIIRKSGHKDRNFYIVARATDNYKATFSWAELYNNVTGDNTYVIFEENGMPLKVRGEMMLICTSDIKTGLRHVLWLKSIEVYRID